MTDLPTQLEKLSAAATPGPWMAQVVRETTGFRMVRTYVLDSIGDPVAMVQANGAAEEEANARLLAELRNAVPEIIATYRERDELEARVAELEARDLTGLALAVGMVLADPIGDENRVHFSKKLLEAAEKNCPGIVPEHYRKALKPKP